MSNLTLIHDDSTEPYTVSIHSFSVVNAEDDIMIVFEVEERDYSSGGNGKDWKLIEVSYPGTMDSTGEELVLAEMGIEEDQLIDLAIDLLAKDNTLEETL